MSKKPRHLPRFDVKLELMVILVFSLVLGPRIAGSDASGIGSQMDGAGPFIKCGVEPNQTQTYALCAAAECFMYNEVAYCRCQIENGESISAPFQYPALPPGAPKQNICDLNNEGVVNNAFMASTFSLPETVEVGYEGPRRPAAVYTCNNASVGVYAQCDGGICFPSTTGKPFPGFDLPLGPEELICSCPPTLANAGRDPLGYQFMAPLNKNRNCRQTEFRKCGHKTNMLNGTVIPVGAPTGVARVLAELLSNGNSPAVNVCLPGRKKPIPVGELASADAVCQDGRTIDSLDRSSIVKYLLQGASLGACD